MGDKDGGPVQGNSLRPIQEAEMGTCGWYRAAPRSPVTPADRLSLVKDADVQPQGTNRPKKDY